MHCNMKVSVQHCPTCNLPGSPSTHSFYSKESYVKTSSAFGVDDIVPISELETEEDAIIIVQDEITYLDDLSLEGDIPDNVSDIIEVRQKDLLTES
jgi:hypothetical protein